MSEHVDEPELRQVLDDLDTFARQAMGAMRSRLREKARIWGMSWQDGVYTDADNQARLRRAVDHLVIAVERSRRPDATAAERGEPWKRAADVANQAFMLADPQRKRS